MSKIRFIIIIFSLIICAGIVIILLQNNNKDDKSIEFTNNSDETLNDLAVLLNSSADIKNDTIDYTQNVMPKLKQVFEQLNNNTDTALDCILDNKTANLDKLISNIQVDEAKINAVFENAYKNAKSKEFKNAYKSVQKYIQLQNTEIYNLVEQYKMKNYISYETFYNNLHKTHGSLSDNEINGIQFLTGVDILTNEKF